MQNLGFAYAIDPALPRLYPRAGAARARRSSGTSRFFNCHPYMAAAIVGGAIHHEQRVAAGAGARRRRRSSTSPRCRGRSRRSGDGFFWTALRPFFGALARRRRAARRLAGDRRRPRRLQRRPPRAAHPASSASGYRGGDAVVAAIARLGLPLVADRLRAAGAALCGVAAAIVGPARGGRGGRGGRRSSRRWPPARRVRSRSRVARASSPPRTSRPSRGIGAAAAAGPSTGAASGMPRHERTFVIVNSLGLHARAAAQLVQTANRYRAEIHVEKDGMQVNGKSIMGVLTLAAAKGSRSWCASRATTRSRR